MGYPCPSQDKNKLEKKSESSFGSHWQSLCVSCCVLKAWPHRARQCVRIASTRCIALVKLNKVATPGVRQCRRERVCPRFGKCKKESRLGRVFGVVKPLVFCVGAKENKFLVNICRLKRAKGQHLYHLSNPNGNGMRPIPCQGCVQNTLFPDGNCNAVTAIQKP